ncbi:Maf1 regulator-domain-containing protein [Abortiporus biennis]|nr:Maf1 regulator-domain-containing protein [Abortiporus biennis]
MKYIEIPELSQLQTLLTHEGPECSVHTRIEAYSCKNIKRDKKLFHSMESAYKDEVSHSPPIPSYMALDREPDMTPFGPMKDQSSRKTLYLLIATLNVAFPDHDFSDVRPAQFNKEESGASVLNALSTTLFSPHRGMQAPRTYSAYPPTSSDFFPSSVPTSSSPLDYIKPSPYAPSKAVSGTHPQLYRKLDEVIGLSDCEVYSYTPDIEFDPHANDIDDDEDDVGSLGDEESSTDEEETTFQFDDYDVDEHPHRLTWRSAVNGRNTSSMDSELSSTGPMKRHGALLWSSHWFFVNRKLKRILFITVWARSRGYRSWTDEDEFTGSPEKVTGERFMGWEGAVGAGARALGLSATL